MMLRICVAGTLLLSSGLLFIIQPMTSRALLPAFGGAQVVWATSLVFYQSVVLVGYALTHLMRRRLGLRGVIGTIIGLAVAGLISTPVVLPTIAGPQLGAPPAEVVVALAFSVGLPAIALSVASPSLQAGFAATDDPHAADPYPFFAVSNAGSLFALIAYPFLVEPRLGLGEQATAWSAGYAIFVGSVVVSTVVVTRRSSRDPLRAERASSVGPILGWRRVGTWILLAAVPSALTVSVTSVLTLDLAPMPLLWVVPLALYLLGYALAFAPRGTRLVRASAWSLPIAVILVMLVALGAVTGPLWLVLAIPLTAVLLVATALHGRLAEDRPPAERLTAFYLAAGVGGVGGGAAAALVAPLVFDRLTEYPLLLVAALLLAPIHVPAGGSEATRLGGRGMRVVVTASISLTAVLILGSGPSSGGAMIAIALPLLLLLPGKVGFAVVAGAVLVVAQTISAPGVLTDRSYYSLLRVVDDGQGRRGLYSGTTLQGIQRLGDQATVPAGYYRPGSPVGMVISCLQEARQSIRMGVVGLGVGGLAAYGREADSIAFFELDPLVVRLATDPAIFTVLSEASGEIGIRVGDGRLLLAEEPPSSFDLIVVDAFTSNAIPAHLLTTEALASALTRLRPDGVVAINVSNRYADLEPVVAAAARDLGIAAFSALDPGDPADLVEVPPSHWVVLVRDPIAGAGCTDLSPWSQAEAPHEQRAWTDDRIDLPSVIRWGF